MQNRRVIKVAEKKPEPEEDLKLLRKILKVPERSKRAEGTEGRSE